MKHKSPDQFKSLYDLLEYFKEEQTCLEYLAEQRWQGSVTCPHCNNNRIYELKGKTKRYKCGGCRKQFTARAGLIFEDSKLPLRKWFGAIYLLLSHKKGISSYQVARDLGITQKTAWFVGHRIRFAIRQGSFERQLNNEVQADETFVGGKNKNRHWDKKVKNSQGRSFKDKTPVLGLLESEISETIERPHKILHDKTVLVKIVSKEGNIRCFVTKDTSAESLQPVVIENIEKGTTLITDEWLGYNGLENDYDLQRVNHKRKQYINESGHSSNGVENFWSHFRRGLTSTYSGRVTPKHLQRYVDESVYRYNNKSLSDAHKSLNLLQKVNGSLKYKQLVYGNKKES